MVQMLQLVQVPLHTRTREKRLFRHNGYFMTVCCYGKQTQKHSRAYTTADLYARVCAYVRIHVCEDACTICTIHPVFLTRRNTIPICS